MIKKSSMDKEILCWNRYNYAVSSFCFEQVIQNSQKEEIIQSLIGEELEWCGHQGYLFLASSYFDSKQKIDYLESKCANLESFVATETSTVTNLRKILKQSQRTAEDTEWQLQEQLAHTNNLLINEREVNLDLKQEISLLQNKLVEVETFMDSDSGKLLLQFEEELAVSKLRIAELEEEKDCLELQVRNRKPLSRKDPNML